MTGRTVGRALGSPSLRVRGRERGHRENRSLENVVQDVSEHQTETDLQRFEPESSYQRRTVRCHQSGHT